jgi:hypothetical protein
LNSAARALPTWKYPVGDGAKRTRGVDTGTSSVMEREGAVRGRAREGEV